MTDYNNFATSFSQSRKNMKWEEIEYFFSHYTPGNMLDVGCGSGRLLQQYREYFGELPESYLGADLSSGLIEEAQKIFPHMDFLISDMLDLSILPEASFDSIFFIASFHHLESGEERENMMNIAYKILKKGGKIYMTNWALESELHQEKYKSSQILGSDNRFGSRDFSIKLGKYQRFYHSFHVEELDFLAKKYGYTVLENREFENQKNIITILQK